MQIKEIDFCSSEEQRFHEFFAKLFRRWGVNADIPFKIKQTSIPHEGMYNYEYFMVNEIKDVNIMFIPIMFIGYMGVVLEDDYVHLHNIHIIPKYRNQGLGSQIMNRLKFYCDQTDRILTLHVEPTDVRMYIEEKHGLKDGQQIGKKLAKQYNKQWTNSINRLIRFYEREGLTRVKQPISKGITMQYINDKNNKLT